MIMLVPLSGHGPDHARWDLIPLKGFKKHLHFNEALPSSINLDDQGDEDVVPLTHSGRVHSRNFLMIFQ